MRVFYLSQGKLYMNENGKERYLACGAVENYRRNLHEIQKRNEWKTTGAGAVFMGVASSHQIDPSQVYAQVESFQIVNEDQIVYAAALERNCGIYIKGPDGEINTEGFIIRQNDRRIYEIDYDPETYGIIASVSNGRYERHLALYHAEHSDCRVITEGDSVDVMPSFSKQASNRVYYSSAGIFVDSRRHTVHHSSYGIYMLDMKMGEVTEILKDEKYDYIRAREDMRGNIYFIRRPKETDKKKGSLKDTILIPFKVLKAIFGWLNFFTQRYSGESLTQNTEGANPSKYTDKSEKEIFIDGNMINVEKTLKENELAGEKYPGIVPNSWELMKMGLDGKTKSIKKGIIDYTLDDEGTIIFSNGKYVLQMLKSGEEEIICKADIAVNLAI